jgi:predicted phosphodiesterase
MRVAVLSDIHGNRPAFEAALAAASDGADVLWCLGDLVGYGAEPDACVALARERCRVCLAGNHDLAVRGELPDADFSTGARLAVQWTRATIGREQLDWLARHEPQGEARGLGLYHASPRDPVWEYVLSLAQAEACLDVQPQRVALIGHSHVALSFGRRRGGDPVDGTPRTDGDTLDISRGRWLLNPGSVGQPRDGDPRAAWLDLDLDTLRATWRRVEYDVEAAAAAILDAGLPRSLAERLHLGQ